jgi:hypothetical protein
MKSIWAEMMWFDCKYDALELLYCGSFLWSQFGAFSFENIFFCK